MGHYPILVPHVCQHSPGREELLWGFEPGRSFFGNGFPQLIVDELGWILLIAGIAGIATIKRPLSHIATARWVCISSSPGLIVTRQLVPGDPAGLSAHPCGSRRSHQRIQNSAVKGRPQARSNATAIACGDRRAKRADHRADSLDRLARRRFTAHRQPQSAQDTALDQAALLIDQPLPPGIGPFRLGRRRLPSIPHANLVFTSGFARAKQRKS